MKVGVVHTGARDSYQVALSFYERGNLDALCTSGYNKGLVAGLYRAFGRGEDLVKRSAPISPARVYSNYIVDLAKHFGRAINHEPSCSRLAEDLFGRIAAYRLNHADVVIAYNYMAHVVLPRTKRAKILFQCHPNPIAAIDLIQSTLNSTCTVNTRNSLGFNVEREIAWGKSYRNLLQSEHSLADRIIAPSTFVATSLLNAGADAEKICIIPYGCDAVIDRRPKRLSPGKRKQILFVGQLVWRKGAELLPEIAKNLSADCNLIIVTRGICDEQILFELSRTPNVVIHRNIPRQTLDQIYSSSDILLFPSRFEGYGLVINEALSHGLPVVATQSTALPDLLAIRDVGNVIAELSVDVICETVRLVLEENRYNECSAQALELAEINSWKHFRQEVYGAAKNLHENFI
jgi:glycosyltransferase involved in cell wall biosynthesis